MPKNTELSLDQGLGSNKEPGEAPELPTIWRVNDELWAIIEPILLQYHPPKKTGRPRANWRNVLDGIIFHARSTCQWNHLPASEFGDDSTIHRWFQEWARSGALLAVWRELATACEQVGGIDWEWQSADGSMVKALGIKKKFNASVGPNPTDRAKPGTKISIVVEGNGRILGVEIGGANVHDSQLLFGTLDAIIPNRPFLVPGSVKENLCLDKAYDNPSSREAVDYWHYIPHIRKIGEPPLLGPPNYPGYKPRRWVVERALSWLKSLRAVGTRRERKDENYLGLIHLGIVLLWYRWLWTLRLQIAPVF